MKGHISPEFQTFCSLMRIRTLRSLFMSVRNYWSCLACACLVPFFIISCGDKQQDNLTVFSKTDSLTDTYLALQDSVLQSWNMMMNDDNHKLDAMNSLLHELAVSGAADPQLLQNYQERLAQLKRSRYTQKTLANNHIVEEYDFASNSLVTELLTLTESRKEFAYNSTLQKLADQIRTADQRIGNYRQQYDDVTARYNTFLEQNRAYLKEVDADSVLEKRPLFQMASEF
jgi:hypothetical protein